MVAGIIERERMFSQKTVNYWENLNSETKFCDSQFFHVTYPHNHVLLIRL